MIAKEQEDDCSGRDTTMCGDPISWFPMRVTYSRELKVKAELDRLAIENFLPMTYKLLDADTENPHRELVPAINNLIFIHSSKDRISSLKSTNAVLQPLRYMMDRTAQQPHAIMIVPDAQMQNFMRVASKTDDSVMFLNDETVVGKVGKHVLIDALRRVMNPLFPEGDILIEEALTIAVARDMMHGKTYDLVILDMVIPELEGAEASRTGGVEYLDEIENNDSIFKPLQIIGLTEYETEYKQQQAQFRDRLWHLLFYSLSRLDWKKQLKDKVMQLAKMKENFIRGIENRNKYDIGIICAISEEFEQMQNAFEGCDWEDKTILGLPYSFKVTKLTTSGMRDLHIIAACAEHPGVCATTVLATSLYNVARVEAIFMTGITAGMEGRDVKFDDIVIADSVMDYAKGKMEEKDSAKGVISLLPEISQMSADHALISKVSSFCRDQDIIDDINDDVRQRGLKDKTSDITPRVSKTICGPFVMQSETLMEILKRDDRKLQALDMEGYGLYFTSYILGCPALWIKSVCDYGVDGKDNSRHKPCAYISARFLYEFLREKF